MKEGVTSAVVGLLLACRVAPGIAADLERSLDAEPGGTLRIVLDRGAVQVDSHDDEAVRIDAHASGWPWDVDFEFVRQGTDVHLAGKTRAAEGTTAHLIAWGLWPISLARVEVHAWVPRDYSLEVHTSGGRVEAANVRGRVVAATRGGAIRVGHVEGSVLAESSGGAIDVADVAGEVRARTSGGAIQVARVGGAVEARTSGGQIEVREAAARVTATTSGGAVSASFTGVPGGSLETSGGSISVRLPAGRGANLDAQTSGGRVEVASGLAFREGADPHHLVGAIDGGGETLRLRTSGGSISVAPL